MCNDYDEETPNHNNWYFCPDFCARKCEGSRQKSILLTLLDFTIFWANVTHLLILKECQPSKKEIHLLQPAAEQRSWVWLTSEQETASWPTVSLQTGVSLSQPRTETSCKGKHEGLQLEKSLPFVGVGAGRGGH